MTDHLHLPVKEIFYKNAHAKFSGTGGRGISHFAAEAANALAGGVWVGGTMVLTAEELTFRASDTNRLTKTGTIDFACRLSEIVNATVGEGFGTKIIVVHTKHGEFSFKCFGAVKAHRQLLAAVTATA
jgi:hypothetical protein